ncbi:Coiled-coil domain-containing protein 25 like protein [Tritrichomonas foetus]|uniref:Coiled-coil domain-containing protein 25 like protein n=1 Tax=Tritrichomonas foetus TaxID=1144522 RepID=A0A1J4JH55_9EUKA|nr:Coiled-coil domain-containing protein 25 like protein [Tritrichomonas foetus]|eukprot:OHS96596.1 Coiled-coil domain-containing protein 25 like protein [Tritrichomonas foetus]
MVIIYMIHDHLLFVGNDKFENDGLIKYSQRYMKELNAPVLWFHVDDLSSPHAYVRLNEGEKEPSPILVQLCSQIVKNGSIEGVKRPAVDVIYTSCANLTKSKGMKVGQVSFLPGAHVVTVHGVRKDNNLLKQLEKVKEIQDLVTMEKELDDLIHNSKKKKAAKNDDDWDEDDWGIGDDDAPKQTSLKDQMAAAPKAEFSTNLEDDFM